jgi:hypothetical protein
MLMDESFQFLGHYENGVLVGGAVLRDWGGQEIGLSNEWAASGMELDMARLLACASDLHAGRAVVGYAWGDDLDACLDAGFIPLGPHLVWTH